MMARVAIFLMLPITQSCSVEAQAIGRRPIVKRHIARCLVTTAVGVLAAGQLSLISFFIAELTQTPHEQCSI